MKKQNVTRLTIPRHVPGIIPVRLPKEFDFSTFMPSAENFEMDCKMEMLDRLSQMNHPEEKIISEFRSPDGLWFVFSEFVKQWPFVKAAAKTKEPILITGPSGTGKEIIARLCHDVSPRRKKNFVPINCGGLNEETLISELFGHVKGAFTGAVADKRGAVDKAEKGTLFLDEIGDMPALAQARLLRFLNDGSFQRLGALGENTKSDVRVICATNKDLPQLIKEGKFREDLYYRINVVPVVLPPLSITGLIAKKNPERSFEEVFRHFAVEFGYVDKEQKYSYALPKMSAAALDALKNYQFPGNYRDLTNILKYAFLKCDDKTITPDDLPEYVFNSNMSKTENDVSTLPAHEFFPAVNKMIFDRLDRELKDHKGNVSATAKTFGMINTRFDRLRHKAQNGLAI